VWDGDSRLVIGSLLGHELPRVVQIDDFKLDAQPEGIILVMKSLDVPGVVGQVATLLGQHSINIAEWRMGRTRHEDNGQTALNLSFINLDAPASAEVLAQLTGLEKVISVRQVTL
jgi:D-3-phosphoglycerate dehydrogenase